ncbi:MAG: cupredoxin domain-containing protein [Chloroflexi bacterium]|nr:cupredoxin domain-containing protein [Chloroflexota bacterium]
MSSQRSDIKWPPRRWLATAATAVILLALVTAACASPGLRPIASGQTGAGKAAAIQPAKPPAQPSVKPPAVAEPGPVAFIPAEKRTPEQWMEYLGVRLVETRDPSGPPAYTPKDGDQYFFSNESTTWGASNTRNNVAVIDANAKKVVARSDVAEEYSLNYASHGMAVSQDGKWVYLPALGAERNFVLILDAHTLKIAKVYESLGRPHHINNITLPDSRDVIMVTDFGWNWAGSGIWVIDPSNENQIVGGLSRADFSGHPYVASGDVGGFMYVTVPAAKSALREDVEGLLAKVDLKTWKVVDAVPVGDPCWPEPTHDGAFVWVTECGHSKVAKVDTKTMKVVAELSTGPGPWGAKLSYDETKLYVADKGEARGYGQQGRTMTIIDTTASIVSNVVPIGRTTDHVLISPDGKEVWATSNAEHAIYVVDTDTEQLKQIIKMPAGGDTHGGTWVQYHADGSGGIWGEVVASYTGLHGSARKAQAAFFAGERPAVVTVTSPGIFSPSQITVAPGAVAKLVFTNGNGTSRPPIQLEGKELGIPVFELGSGQRKTVEVRAPAQPGTMQIVNPADPKRALTVVVADRAAAPAAAAPAMDGQRELTIKTLNNKFSVGEINAKPGETVRITLVNGDDENHNIVSADAKIVSPTVGGGQTGTFTWQAPATAGSYEAICLFHPTMKLTLNVK